MQEFFFGVFFGTVGTLVGLFLLLFRVGRFSEALDTHKDQIRTRIKARFRAKSKLSSLSSSSSSEKGHHRNKKEEKGRGTREERKDSLSGTDPDEEHPILHGSIDDYLAKVIDHYNEHPDKSFDCTWLNIITQRFFHSLSRLQDDLDFENILNLEISQIDLPDLIGETNITGIDFGTAFPVIHHVNVESWHYESPIELSCEITYKGDFHLALKTSLDVNFPLQCFASLPIEISLSEFELNAKIHLVLDPALDVWSIELSFLEQPTLSFQLGSDIGYHTTLTDLPHLYTVAHSAIMKACAKHLHSKHNPIQFRFSHVTKINNILRRRRRGRF